MRSNVAAILSGLLLIAFAAQAQQSAPVSIEETHPQPRLHAGTCRTPTYPNVLKQAGIQGPVVIAFVIDTSGSVDSSSFRVVSTAHPLFSRPARQATASCRYSPGRLAGHAVRVQMTRTVNFVLPRPARAVR
jgi:TonB family protein